MFANNSMGYNKACLWSATGDLVCKGSVVPQEAGGLLVEGFFQCEEESCGGNKPSCDCDCQLYKNYAQLSAKLKNGKAVKCYTDSCGDKLAFVTRHAQFREVDAAGQCQRARNSLHACHKSCKASTSSCKVMKFDAVNNVCK